MSTCPTCGGSGTVDDEYARAVREDATIRVGGQDPPLREKSLTYGEGDGTVVGRAEIG
jgi:hypothetical protein